MACREPLSTSQPRPRGPQGISIGPHPIPQPHWVAISVWSPLGSSVSHEGSLAVYAKLGVREETLCGAQGWGDTGDPEGQGLPSWLAQQNSTT